MQMHSPRHFPAPYSSDPKLFSKRANYGLFAFPYGFGLDQCRWGFSPFADQRKVRLLRGSDVMIIDVKKIRANPSLDL
jgi:hypothetical protein